MKLDVKKYTKGIYFIGFKNDEFLACKLEAALKMITESSMKK